MYDAGPDGNTGTCNRCPLPPHLSPHIFGFESVTSPPLPPPSLFLFRSEDKIGDKQDCDLYSF